VMSAHVKVEKEFAAHADAVSSRLSDFANVDWIRCISQVTIDGPGSGTHRTVHGLGPRPWPWHSPDDAERVSLADVISDSRSAVSHFKATVTVMAGIALT
jgi:hypothetical protein